MKQLIFIFLLFFSFNVSAQFTPGNLVVYRIGNGLSLLETTGNGNPVFLDEYTPSGVLVQSIPLPTADGGGNLSIVSRNALTDGLLNRSSDGRYIVFPGYNSTVGMPASNGDKIVGRIDFAGNINTSTVVSSSGVIMSAYSNDGYNIWSIANNNHVYYNTLGSAAGTQVTNGYGTSARDIKIFDGQLYISTANSISAIGTGTPTTGIQPFNNLPGIANNFYQFMMFDLDPVEPGVDVLYVAYQGNVVYKFSLVGGSWVSNGTVVTGTYTVGLTGSETGGVVTLYITADAGFGNGGGGTIRTITDVSGHNAAFTGSFTTIATASTNTSFRGIAFTPTQFILPVTFKDFNGTWNKREVELKWNTAGTEELVNYSIERSSDGRQFHQIGSFNSSSESHVYKDVAPMNGINYYRIKAVETSGKKTYSTILKMQSSFEKATIKIYPNIIEGDHFNVQVSNMDHGKLSMVLYNTAGQVVQSFELNHQGRSSIHTIQLKSLSPGLYILKCNENFQRIMIR